MSLMGKIMSELVCFLPQSFITKEGLVGASACLSESLFLNLICVTGKEG